MVGIVRRHACTRRHRLVAGVVVMMAACALATAPARAGGPSVPQLEWSACGDAGAECATARVPLDYDHPRGRKITVALARTHATDPDRRIGSLFFNFGGPGAPAAQYVEAFGTELFSSLAARFDIVGMDPRGVGESSPALDCGVNQERSGLYGQPFPRPSTVRPRALVRKAHRYVERCIDRNGARFLRHISTANVARDMNLMRRAVGDRRLTYLGFSYGTLLGSTYAALFPRRFRALVLDGPVDAETYLNRPLANLAAQSTGFEVTLGRFLRACRANQVACAHFGGADPRRALNRLIRRLDRAPAPVPGADPRVVDGDDARVAVVLLLYSKFNWPLLGEMLASAKRGDVSLMRAVADAFYGRLDDGTYDPFNDRYFLIGAAEQRYPRGLDIYLRAGARSYRQHPHFWWNNGYVELAYGLYRARVKDRDAFYGPFRLPPAARTPLVVATTFDPATPYPGALNLVRDLGDARLLTMRGDNHTAYGGQSACIDRAVEAYLIRYALPPAGKVCVQQVPFEATASAKVGQASVEHIGLELRLHMRQMR